MMRSISFQGAFAAMLFAACAGNKPTDSTFQLVEGRRIGALELVVDQESGWTKKSRDSVKFDNQHLNTKPRIGFKYPGRTIGLMKVYDGEKLLKTCDEGSYARTGSRIDPNVSQTAALNGPPKKIQEYSMKYNLECEVSEQKEGMTVELHDGNGLVSKYNVNPTEAQPLP